MTSTFVRRLGAAAVGALLAVGTAACVSSGGGGGGGQGSGAAPSSGAQPGGSPWATATRAAAAGGMDALVAAAKEEGALNVIALPPDWANYGAIIEAFRTKYGITVYSANPEGSTSPDPRRSR